MREPDDFTESDLRDEIASLHTEQTRLREALNWQPVETAPKDGTVILRPHRIWGAMDVRYATEPIEVTTLSKDIDWKWLNGDYTTAWTEDAFHPFWMPLPVFAALSSTPTPEHKQMNEQLATLKYTVEKDGPCAACAVTLRAGELCYRDVGPDDFRHLHHGPVLQASLQSATPTPETTP